VKGKGPLPEEGKAYASGSTVTNAFINQAMFDLARRVLGR
jgi:hypothetical protein